jgi:uncharacterized protein (TIGR02996 family)
MATPDDLLAACAASPDDDAPRLVWADLVGGERGELVVLQCDLARGGLTPHEVASRRRRERELLDAHAVEWAGSLASVATRWSFRRGFIETARFDSLAFDPADHPLLSTITVDVWGLDFDMLVSFARRRPLRGLALQGWISRDQTALLRQIAAAPEFRALRAFQLQNLRGEVFDAAIRVIKHAPIEQLRLSDHQLDRTQIDKLLDAAPRLAALEIDTLLLGTRQSLRALRTGRVDLRAVVATSAATLEHLACGFSEAADNVAQLSQLRALRTLEVSGLVANQIIDGIVRAPGFAALRRLRVQPSLEEAQLRAIVERFGAQLELLLVPTGTFTRDVEIAGELRVVDGRQPASAAELLHHEPAALFTIGKPCAVMAPPISIAHLALSGRIWEIPPQPAEDRVVMGRSSDNVIQLDSPTVGRRHASLEWRNGAHELRDLGSANGTYVDDAPIEALRINDGAELLLGDVRLRFFTGPGARERAEQALADTKRTDPNTRLPRHAAPPFQIEIANWTALNHAQGAVVANLIMRAVATELASVVANEPLWFVRPGVFGLASRAAADRIGDRTLQLDVGVGPLDVELRCVSE